MSEDERSQILSELVVIKRLLRGAGLGFGGAMLAVATLVVTDHFDQADLRRTMDTVEPRVEKLWWRTFPNERVASDTPSVSLVFPF